MAGDPAGRRDADLCAEQCAAADASGTIGELEVPPLRVECANHDAKAELGWGDFQAQKFVAWEHHLALTILAGWFIAQTKVDWALQQKRDGRLADELGVGSLPALSVANVREVLQAVMPLQQLSPEQARRLVVKHLVDRSRSTRSRLQAQLRARGPT